MKGIVFTEFMEMVENTFGYDTLETIIENARLPHAGMYVSGGTYPHTEMIQLVHALSAETKADVPTLLQAFGKYLFGRLISLFPHFAEGKTNPLEFIASVDHIIHIEVRKLYPDAELPKFVTISQEAQSLVVDYISHRHMEDFGIGLMMGCAEYYQQPIHILQDPVELSSYQGTRFTITMNAN